MDSDSSLPILIFPLTCKIGKSLRKLIIFFLTCCEGSVNFIIGNANCTGSTNYNKVSGKSFSFFPRPISRFNTPSNPLSNRWLMKLWKFECKFNQAHKQIETFDEKSGQLMISSKLAQYAQEKRIGNEIMEIGREKQKSIELRK